MPNIHALCLPIFSDNYVWMLAADNHRALIVDPGDATPVLRRLAEGLIPEAILITHHHPDHLGGAAEILAAYDIPCYAPVDARIPMATHRVHDSDRLHFDALPVTVDVLAVPGHTASHVAYLAEGHLFCGDALFSLGCGRLFEGSPEQLLATMDRLRALPDATKVCCAHEYTLANGRFARHVEPDNPDLEHWLTHAQHQRERGAPSLPSTIALERRCNPFMRWQEPAILAALTREYGEQPASPSQAIAWLRQWKDRFV